MNSHRLYSNQQVTQMIAEALAATEKYYQDVRDCQDFLARISPKIDAILAEKPVLTGRCQMEYARGTADQDGFVCGKQAPTFCWGCGKEICLDCAVKIAMETYCVGCAAFMQSTLPGNC